MQAEHRYGNNRDPLSIYSILNSPQKEEQVVFPGGAIEKELGPSKLPCLKSHSIKSVSAWIFGMVLKQRGITRI